MALTGSEIIYYHTIETGTEIIFFEAELIIYCHTIVYITTSNRLNKGV